MKGRRKRLRESAQWMYNPSKSVFNLVTKDGRVIAEMTVDEYNKTKGA